MVRNKTFFKSAFTMIELIFAIVIIAISVLSLAMVTQVTSKGMQNSFAQEAIFAASAELNQVLSFRWDISSQETQGELSKVLHTGSPSDCNTSDGKQRQGHVHRMCLEATTAPIVTSSISSGAIDAQRTLSDISLTEVGTVGDGSSGYKSDYNMSVAVHFSPFAENYTTHNNNIKNIVVTVKKGANPYVVLQTFSANIGEVAPAKRRIF